MKTIFSLLNRPPCWLFLTCCLVFSPSVFNGFVWLDESEILDGGYRVENVSDLKAVFGQPLDTYAFRKSGEARARGGYYRPIYALSISADWWLWNSNPLPYHLHNILLHSLLVIALYSLGSELCSSKEQRNLVLAASLLFATTPLCMQSVVWISGRKDLLCALWSTCALLLLCKFKLDLGNTTKSALKFMTCLLCFCLALGCKEQAVVVPVLGFYLVVIKSKKQRSVDCDAAKIDLGLAALFGALVFILCGYLLLRSAVIGSLTFSSANQVSSVGALIGALKLFSHYIYISFFPFQSVLSDRWAPPPGIGFKEIVAILFVLTIGFVVARQKSDRQLFVFGVFWALVWLLPVLGFIPLRHEFAERYLYPAVWGWYLCGCTIVYSIIKELVRSISSGSAGRVVLAAGGIASVLFGLRSFYESQTWANDVSLFERAIEVDPLYIEGHVALGRNYQRASDFRAAEQCFSKAIDIAAQNGEQSYWSPFVTYMNRGMAYQQVGNHRAAISDFQTARTFQPDLSLSFFGEGVSFLKLGQFTAARDAFEQAVKLNPRDHRAIGNLALSYLSLNQPRETERLLVLFEENGTISRTDLRTLGTARLLLAKYETARRNFETLVAESPRNGIDRAKLAWAHWGCIDFEKARKMLAEAEELDPENATISYVEALPGLFD